MIGTASCKGAIFNAGGARHARRSPGHGLREGKGAPCRGSLQGALCPAPAVAAGRMRPVGGWGSARDTLFVLDPAGACAFMATGIGTTIAAAGVLRPKEPEILSIAFDASTTPIDRPMRGERSVRSWG